MQVEQPIRHPSGSHLYEKVRDRMQTGDVIVFSGNYCISRLDKWTTRSPYSHVAMVIAADLGGGFGESVLIIEAAAPQTQRDPKGRKVINGVQIHWLSKRLDMYDGKAWWLPLKNPIPQPNLVTMQAWLRHTYNQRRPFDIVQAASSGSHFLQHLGLGQRDYSALYCAELIAAALQKADVIDPAINPSRQTPKDVVNLPCFQHPPIPIKTTD
jgi:hypothetical protein